MTRVAGRTLEAGPEMSGGTGSVAAAAVAMMDRCEWFVRAVPADKYAVESRTLKGGTIGKHIRHTLDHFRAVLDVAKVRGGVIDYDHRQREVPMETLPGEAIKAICEIRERLVRLDDATLEAAVRVRVMVNGEGAEAELGSTLGRELAFVSHHAVHHHAMLGAIAAEHGIVVDGEFGRAPSTVSHDRSTKARKG